MSCDVALYVVTTAEMRCAYVICILFFFQAEDGIRDLVRSRGLGDVYKRQVLNLSKEGMLVLSDRPVLTGEQMLLTLKVPGTSSICLLYTSDAADERSSVDLGGRRIIKNKKYKKKKEDSQI